MAHLIESATDFVSYKTKPWHGIGTITDKPMTIEEAKDLSNLNFEVAIAPNEHTIYDADGNVVSRILSDGSFFSYRTDNNRIFGKRLGDKYTPLQNADALDWVGDLVAQGYMTIETAGCLDGGRIIFATLKYNKPIIVGPNDEVDQYLLISNGHDGSMSVTAAHVGIRVVCMNTLQVALKQATSKYTIRHTSNVKSRLEEVLMVLRQAQDNHDVLEQGFRKLNSIRAKSTIKNPLLGLHDFLGKLFLDEQQRIRIARGEAVQDVLSSRKIKLLTDVMDSTLNGVGQRDAVEMSPWWMLNGVTNYFSNVKKYKDSEDRMNSMMYGNGAKVMADAMVLAEKIKPGIHIDPRFKLNLN